MLKFRIVDPAMGSGHFLVDALDVIANRFAKFLADDPRVDAGPIKKAREEITAIGKKYGIEALGPTIGDFELLRRIVMRNCVYGVDLNPMAVELAKLSLWLHAFVPGLPLSFLGHNLRHGNALVGIVGPEIAEQVSGNLFGNAVSEALAKALEHAKQLISLSDLSYEEVKKSEGAQDALEVATVPLMNAFDAYACRVFARDDELASRAERERGRASLEHHDGLSQVLENKIKGEEKRQVVQAQKVARRLSAFHWPLAFPEVFLRENPGFDVVLGNPPWEKARVERLGFYTQFVPGLKSFESQEEQEKTIRAYERRHPDVQQYYDDEIKRNGELREILLCNFSLARSGDPDLFRAFAELALTIARRSGAIGMVFPRTLLAADGMAPFRKRLFEEFAVIADFGLNSGGWIFADAEPRYTVVALAALKTGTNTITTGGPATNEAQWASIPTRRVTWALDDLEKASPGLEVPLIPDEAAAGLFHKMVKNGQPFSDPVDGVQFRPWRAFDATNDRKSGLLQPRDKDKKGWPVYGGRNFYLWEPECGETQFVLDRKAGIDALQRKRLRSDVWADVKPNILADKNTLPQMRAQILFRDIARSTDSRTVIAALVPPHTFSTHKAPVLLTFGNSTPLDEALRLGIMSSLPFDWLARRRVETNLTYGILNALPVPRLNLNDSLASRVAALTARISCVDDRFSEFASACGVEVGSLVEQGRDDAIAEIDAVVAAMYRLEMDDLDVVFADFTKDAVPNERREAVKKHFAKIGTRPQA